MRSERFRRQDAGEDGGPSLASGLDWRSRVAFKPAWGNTSRAKGNNEGIYGGGGKSHSKREFQVLKKTFFVLVKLKFLPRNSL